MNGFDLGRGAAIDWCVTGPPETFMVDGDGTLLCRFVDLLGGSHYEQGYLREQAKAVE